MSYFDEPIAVATYAEGPPRQVPGFADMQRMTSLLLAERVPEKGLVLVLGAGGGLELTAFAQAQPSWRFVGVDPSRQMLRLAENTLGEYKSRVQLYEGYIENAPLLPFDGATCLLTLHFTPAHERLRTLSEIHSMAAPDQMM